MRHTAEWPALRNPSSGGVPAVKAVILTGTTAWNGISRPEKGRVARGRPQENSIWLGLLQSSVMGEGREFLEQLMSSSN